MGGLRGKAVGFEGEALFNPSTDRLQVLNVFVQVLLVV